MPAAADGTIVVTAPGPDGTGPVVTLLYDPATGALAEPFAITVENAGALIDVHRFDGTIAAFGCVPGAHITAAQLAEAGIVAASDIHAITVTAG